MTEERQNNGEQLSPDIVIGLRELAEGKKINNFVRKYRDSIDNTVLEKAYILAFVYLLDKLSEYKLEDEENPYSALAIFVGDMLTHTVFSYLDDSERITDTRIKNIGKYLTLIVVSLQTKLNPGFTDIQYIKNRLDSNEKLITEKKSYQDLITDLLNYLAEHPFYSLADSQEICNNL